jgi:hypothetical protein
MDWHTLGGWMGGLAGGAIGVLGGLFGTYCSIKNTNGPRERAFLIKASLLCWILIGAFIAGILLIPPQYNSLLMVAYAVLLIFGIYKGNQTQLRIRQEEAGCCEKPMTIDSQGEQP